MRGSKSRADPKYIEAFTQLLKQLVKNADIDPRAPVDIYLAGGSAVQFYTGARLSDDVDAAFSRRIFVPEGEVIFTDSTGKARSIYWDRNYNESFALVHENAHQDAVRMPLSGMPQVRVWFFSPLDLAVSKLSRFSRVDRSDIVELARLCGVTSAALRKRAEEALSYYVGNPEPVRTSIKMACADIDAAVPRSGSKPRKS